MGLIFCIFVGLPKKYKNKKFLLFSYVPKMAAVVRPALLLNKASRGQCNDASACVTPLD